MLKGINQPEACQYIDSQDASECGKTPLPMITGYPKFVGGNGVRVMTTKVVGRFWGRTIPILGWGLLTYDLGMTVYNTQTEYDRIIEGGQ